jgi:hypothetical protein
VVLGGQENVLELTQIDMKVNKTLIFGVGVILLAVVVYYATLSPMSMEPDDMAEFTGQTWCTYGPLDEETWLGMSRRQRDDLRLKKAYWKKTGYCTGPPKKPSTDMKMFSS